ncbi:hypothetical protein [Alkalibaculum sporogenes]|nr:hypothetical protein [Alkalibaculum sporogenes]
MYEIVNDFPNEIIYENEVPCISIYIPTHRYAPDNKQDTILYKNSLKEIEESLKQKYQKIDIKTIMAPLYKLQEDNIFWNNTYDGLAILANSKKCVIYRLQRSVQTLVVVANSFHIKPLIRAFQSADHYQLLGLDRSKFTLYEGNRYGFSEIKLGPDVPRTIEEVLGEEYSQPYLNHGSYGGNAATGGSAMFHGHGSKKEEIEIDIDKFFRYVDKFVLENYSKVYNLPLILVSLGDYHSIFKKISRNPYLVEKGVKESYDSIETDQLKEKVWKEIEPYYIQKTNNLIEEFNRQKSATQGSDILVEVVKAAFENRVKTILVEDEKIISGKINRLTGDLVFGDLNNPENGDVIDDLAKLVLKLGGEVVVLPKARMPSQSGIAAIYRS